MEQDLLNTIYKLRAELHRLAERSGEEKKTKACLFEFLQTNTSLHLVDKGQWFYAVHEEPGAGESIAFRADMDALPSGSGASHLCGHDGHCAVLAGLGLNLENKRLGRNILLIFQHAEEIGAGGSVCSQCLKKHRVSRVYAFHNIPGWGDGTVLLRRGTFACASRGMTLTFTGKPAHAAYPESGKNPGFSAARFISALPNMTEAGLYHGLTMATLIGSKIGEKAFGSAAGNAEIWLTLRAWQDKDLQRLILSVKETARQEAARDGIEVSFSSCDIFPATVNDDETLARLEEICHQAGLSTAEVPEPFRWSEDFGYYGSEAKAVMVGIGAGFDWPQLHTENYFFNDKIIPAALTLFSSLAEFG